MSSRSARFTVVLFWNCLAFITSLVSAFVLSPLVVHGLGIEAYGVWALVFGILDYLSIADLGIRSATVKYVAHYSALDDKANLFKTLNASLLYFLGIAAVVTPIIFFGARTSMRWFHIPPNLVDDYVLLLRLTGLTMAFQLLFNVPKAALEALQDFSTISRINICMSLVRTGLCILVLRVSPGLAGLGWATVAAFWLGFVMLAFSFWRRFPQFVPSFAKFDTAIFRKLLHYGIPTLLGSLANQFLQNGPVLLLGILKNTASVGYYSLVLKMMGGLYELNSQTSIATTSITARLAAEDDRGAMTRAVIYLNRYSFAIFSFVLVFLLVFGDAVFTLWVGPAVAMHCLPLVPWMALGYAFGAAAHQNSIGTLFGLGAHHWYNYGLIAEAVILFGGWMIFVPDRPLSFAAAWWAISIIISRGLRPSWSVCRALGMSFGNLMTEIHLRPLLAALLTTGVALVLRVSVPHSSLYRMAGIAAVTGLAHVCFLLIIVAAPEHRRLLLNFRTMARATA